MSIVYIKTNDKNHITAVNSSALLADTTDWILIDEGEGDRYTHAQSNYFDKPIITEGGAHQYIYLGDRTWRESTTEEMAAEIQPVAPTQPTTQERIEALEAAMLELAEVIANG